MSPLLSVLVVVVVLFTPSECLIKFLPYYPSTTMDDEKQQLKCNGWERCVDWLVRRRRRRCEVNLSTQRQKQSEDVEENSNDMDTYLSLTRAPLHICQSSNVKVSTVDDARERSTSDRKGGRRESELQGNPHVALSRCVCRLYDWSRIPSLISILHRFRLSSPSTSIYFRSASFSPLLRRVPLSVQAVVKKMPSTHFFSALNARTANVKLGSNQCHATLESELTFSVWVCVDLVGESDDV